MNRDIFRIAHSIRMSAEKSDLAEVMLYGEIVPDYGSWYKEDYPNDKSAADFDKDIRAAREAGATRLLLRINSPGGVCTQSIAMRSILANAGFDEITIRIEGLCASAATDIATLPGAHVQIAEGSEYMIHNPWTFAMGFASDLEHAAEHLRSIEKTTRSFYALKSGQPEEQIKAWCDAETWFSAEDAVKYGFCDELLKAKDSKALPAAACVTQNVMSAMRGMYQHVPEQIGVVQPQPETVNVNTATLPTTISATNCVITSDSTAGTSHSITYSMGTAPLSDEYVMTTPAIITVPAFSWDDWMRVYQDGSTASPVAGETTVIKTEEDVKDMDIKDITKDQLLAENPALVEDIRQEAINAERERMQEIDELTLPGYEEDAAQAKANGTSAMDFHKMIVQKTRQKGKDFLAQRKEELSPASNVLAGAAEDNDLDEDDEIQREAKMIAEETVKYAGYNGGMY